MDACTSGFLSEVWCWQDLISGVAGFAAAIFAVLYAWRSESRKATREFEALRRALGVEIRLFATNAVMAHMECKKLQQQTAVSARQIENAVRLPAPEIYPAAARAIGDFGEHAQPIVYFYSHIAVVRDGVKRLLHAPYANGVPSDVIKEMADALLQVSETAVKLLHGTKTGVAKDDNIDPKMAEHVAKLRKEWGPSDIATIDRI